MSSRRLPGKVLAPIAGKPMYLHVYERVASVVGPDRAIVVTSTDPSDTPLCRDLDERGIPYVRGALDDVVARFAEAARRHPAEWYARVSCDSPLLSVETVRGVVGAVDDRYDVVTNVFPRSFPKGQSVEVLRRSTIERLASAPLTPEEREHVTPYLYAHPEEFRIRNVPNPKGDQSGLSDVVDTPSDLESVRRRIGESA
jgi:spore coat polysaccharide biosynthesis protein SpsF